MLISRRRAWEIPQSRVTPESIAIGSRPTSPSPLLPRLQRRAVLGATAALTLGGPAQAGWLFSGSPAAPPPVLKPLSAARNAHYDAGRALTPEADATTYNNYYEFGSGKSVYEAARALPEDPWSIRIEGMVKTPRTIALEDLLKQVSLEERVYRHRCVEAWAMTVPWTGFPLAALVKLAEPTGSPGYVQFTTLADKKTMPGLKQSWYPWPYVEGLTMDEATNELAFLSVGMYGKTTPPQNGAPIRLTVPWKYGFKSAKSIVKVTFTNERPVSFWEQLQDSEYGFWANVNPAVPHPRWSQARERLLGSDEMVATQIWNGYGEFVAGMYTNLKNERLFV